MPCPSTATHRLLAGHDRLSGETPARLGRAAHAWAAGSVETNRSPFPATATHKDTLGQDTPVRGVVPSRSVTVHAPPAGFVEVSKSPFASAITHSEADGQDTAFRPAVSRWTGADQASSGGAADADGAAERPPKSGNKESRSIRTARSIRHTG